ncbi:polysaccharide pyruvyl transferase family protein [Weeksellaceae bacterium A-14]
MKKKLAIITLPLRNYNYGGILQNYALQQYLLKNFEVEVETVNVEYPKPELSFLLNLKTKLYKLVYFNRDKIYKEINRNLENFIQTKIRLTKPVCNTHQFQDLVVKRKYSILVSGSDQVWKPKYILEYFWELMFLSISNRNSNLKKAAYAASFGEDFWRESPDFTKRVQLCLKEFYKISVRENSGLSILKETFGVEGVQHLDPTLLLNKEDYLALFPSVTQNKKLKSRKILYAYILDSTSEKRRILENLAQSLDARLVNVELKADELMYLNRDNYKDFIDIKAESVEDWLASFYQADYVITDSFHGTVFSILFNKPFVALGNQQRGMTRFDSLLSCLCLKERLCTDMEEERIQDILQRPIDYIKVKEIVKLEQRKAYEYWSNIINGN